jgi:hypothetical protein
LPESEVFDPDLYVDGAHEWVKPDKLEFKVDSPLLVVHGCLNEKENECGVHSYRWTGSGLELI